MLEDRLLVWRAQRGSKEAMRRIYEKYKDDLLVMDAQDDDSMNVIT